MSEEILPIAEGRIEAKIRGERERYIHLNAEFQKLAKRERKRFSVTNAKKQRKTIEWERQDFFNKLDISREHFMQRWEQ